MTRKTETEGFLQTYIRYTSGQKSPEVFHRWVAISISLAMMSRKAWVDRKLYILYPNEYILLIGPSGCGKDSAIDIGLDFLSACPNAPEFFPGRISYSSLFGHLHVLGKKVGENGEHLDSSIYLKAPELHAFVGTYPGNQELLATLTELYKSPSEHPYVTRAHGWEALHNVCINFVGGSTKEWLKQTLPNSSIGGGFTARVIIVNSDTARPRRAEIEMPHDHEFLRASLIHDLTAIGMMGGEFSLTTDASLWAKLWYESLPPVSGDESAMASYTERKLDHMIKVAMCLSAMEDDKRIITPSHLLLAKAFLEESEPGMLSVLGGLEVTPETDKQQRILDVIKRWGPITRVELQRRIVRWANKKHLDDALETLIPAGIVGTRETDTGGARKQKSYFITKGKVGE